MAEILYREKVRSWKTSLLFLILTLIFFSWFLWRVNEVGFLALPIVCLCMALVFLFYVFNYWALQITITEENLQLKFGVVGWKTALSNIKQADWDNSPPLIKYGGAGVHFAYVNRRYRAYYNFLEHPRLVITFHDKQGLVQELVFTTRQPEQVLEILQERVKI